MIATVLIGLVVFWLAHNAFEDSKGTALLPYRTVAMQPFVHQPDVPERDQLASHNPEQPPRVLDTTRVWWDASVPNESLAAVG